MLITHLVVLPSISVFQSVYQIQSSGKYADMPPQLINNAKLAVLFTETLQKKFHNSPLPYVEGTNPPEVKVSKLSGACATCCADLIPVMA